MEIEEIKQLLISELGLDEAYVTNDGNHFQIIAVGDIFADLTRMKKQQAVYTPLMPYIADNRMHAVSIKTFTPEEWRRERKLNGF